MTEVKIIRKANKIVKFSCDGHCDWGEEGEDIVCAALSSIVQTAVLGLMQVALLPVDYKVDAKKALLECVLPKNLSETDRHSADMILETMFLGVADLNSEYGKYIKLEQIKE